MNTPAWIDKIMEGIKNVIVRLWEKIKEVHLRAYYKLRSGNYE